jgi:hypothetical protein
MVNNRGSSALLAGADYYGALMERLKTGRTASRAHPFRGRLERLQADVERVYAGPTDRSALSVQSHDEYEELREQYAPLFWHYLGRALRAVGDVEFALMEARIRCLLREFRADAARVLDGP